MLHINLCIKEETRKLENILNRIKMKATTYQNLWDIAKAVLRGRSLPLKTSIRKVERYKINNAFNLSYKKKTLTKVSRRKDNKTRN